MNEAMSLNVNGQAMQIAAGITVRELVEALGCGPRGVAVAVNMEVVRRGDWTVVRLAEGDEVEVLHAVAGG
jgi:sulfur carrier protein